MTTAPELDRPTVPSDLTTDLLVAGTWTSGGAGILPTLNPATGEVLAEVAAADTDDVDRAVAAAEEAFRTTWAAVPPHERAALLHRLADLVERDAQHLATLEALDVGSSFGFAQMLFVPNLVRSLRYYAGWADKLEGQLVPADAFMGRPVHAYTKREPLGVVAAIVPWNSPLMILGWKLAPALATGNVVIVKPSEEAPLSCLHVVRLAAEAGFPAGTVQVLPGAGAVVGEALSLHAGVQKVSFTGSTPVGRRIAQNATHTFKRTTLELGGKSAQLVFADADVERTVPGIAMGLFANQGESCAIGSRVLVHRSLHDQVVEGLREAQRAQVVGDPFDPSTTVGPLISARHRDRVMGYVESGRTEGATLVAGGAAVDRPGFFVEPTVFAGDHDLTIAREEIFGPVGVVIPFDDEDDAIRLANSTEYGLAATVWTGDVTRAHSVADRLRAGAVAVNGWSPLAPQLPWGGVGASGVGRELGVEGILENTETKTVTVVL
ncbi:MAG: aldehyde dehydrogenase family protein [Nocardioides alkalitolerans]